MTTCRNGHEMTPANTGRRHRYGRLETYCLTCTGESRARNQAHRSAARARMRGVADAAVARQQQAVAE